MIRFVLVDRDGDYYAGEKMGDYHYYEPSFVKNIEGAKVFTAVVKGEGLEVNERLPDGGWRPVAIKVSEL